MISLLLKQQSEAMITLAQSLAPGSSRAQCYAISNYKLENGETIAERLRRDHTCVGHALRAATLLVDAGCATEIKNKNPNLFGKFIFIDGSEL